MTKKTYKALVRFVVYGAILLVLACVVFLHRGRQRLLDLMSHTSRKTTEVYSAWTTLAPDEALTWDYVVGTLGVLGYESANGPLEKSGQYRTDGSSIEVWTRGFDFPDQPLPVRRIRLSF